MITMSVMLLVAIIGVKAIGAKNSAMNMTHNVRLHLNESFEAIDRGDFQTAIDEANLARDEIKNLKLIAQSWGQDIQYLRLSNESGSKLVAVERMLNASYLIINSITGLNSHLSKITEESNLISVNKSGKITFDIEESQEALTSIVSTFEGNLKKGKQELLLAEKTLPEEYSIEIKKAVSSIDFALRSIENTKTILAKDLVWLSGADGQPKKIMLLFQNNAELRGGTAGSLGSFGIANFREGELTSLDFGKNIYKLDDPFRKIGNIAPPEPLSVIAAGGSWVLKDAGWAVDGPTAFRDIEHLYELESGEKVDGIIVIDSTAIENLLKETGNIDLPQYGLSINSQNFRKEVEFEVHQGYFGRDGGKAENEPKKIIADMMPIFLDKVFEGLKSGDRAGSVLSAFSQALKSKHMMIYVNDPEFQKRLDRLNFSGGVFPTLGDYLYVNDSNIGGLKSSLSLNQSLKLEVSIGEDGNIKNKLNISRSHDGSSVWPDGINKNFTRVLLPENSSIENFNPIGGNFNRFFDRGYYEDGKKYSETIESGKKNVNFWMTTDPGNTSELEMTYTTGLKVDVGKSFNYNILFQNQPGANADKVTLEINYPKGVEPQNVVNFDTKNRKIVLNFDLSKDRYIKINFK